MIATAAGLGAEGLGSAFLGPGADLMIIATAWAGMIGALAGIADVKLDKITALKIATTILVSFGSFVGGSKLAVQAFAYTGVGTLPALVANGGINAVVTYLTGTTIRM